VRINKLLILFLPTLCYAFTPGSGAEYDFSYSNENAKLSIYIVESREKNVSVEFHFGMKNLWATNMWQQYQLDIRNGSSVGISRGYIKTDKNKPPEKMIKEQFNLNTGVQVHQFLFSDRKEIQKNFIGSEVVELPAGTIKADHYRTSSDGQTVEFWRSNAIRPIGLVKLVSKSKIKESNNYKIELSALLKNIKPAIEVEKAVEMTKDSQKIFQKAFKLK
jgi:hypothetical protein